MAIDRVKAVQTGGPLVLRVQDPQHPQGITAVVWRFLNETQLDSPNPVAQFVAGTIEVPLGAADTLAGKGFLIDGFVKPFGDSPPSTYQIVVTLLQGGSPIHQVVPSDNGAGTIGDTEKRFRYPFFLDIQ